MAQLDFKIISLSEDGTNSSTLQKLRGCNKNLVLDFWHTNCTRCPAALSKLEQFAHNWQRDHDSDTLFVACALSLGDGNQEIVEDMISEWTGLTHVFLEVEHKEAVKSALGMASVPFIVVIDKLGNLVVKGDPLKIDYMGALSSLSRENQENVLENKISSNISVPTSGPLVFDEDF